MRLIEINFHNLPKTLIPSGFALLIFCCVISIKPIHAQDIPNTEEIKSVIAVPSRKKAANPVKTKEVKPKFIAVSLKSSSPIIKEKSRSKTANKETTPENSAIISTKEKTLKAEAIAAVSGTVRFKQYNQGAAGVLIEAIRVDTREMIDSAETNGAGEFKFNKLPAGVDLVFLVSSSNTKPLIFKTSVGNGTKNLDFTVFPK
jgi:hypothetical protein